MDQPRPTAVDQLAKADVNFAVYHLDKGASPEKVKSLLVDRGIDQATASAAVRELLTRAIFSDAAAMLDAGASAKQVEQRLVDKGIEPRAASKAIDVLVAHAQAHARQAAGRGQFRQVLGAFVFIVGIGLFLGNVTGNWPSLPYAGGIVILIGGIIYRAGKKAGL